MVDDGAELRLPASARRRFFVREVGIPAPGDRIKPRADGDHGTNQGRRNPHAPRPAGEAKEVMQNEEEPRGDVSEMKQMKVNWARVVTAGILAGFGLTAQASPVSGRGTWETTLQGRDLDGNLSTFEAYYDTDLNITWLANANYAGTTMNWATANAWAAGLNPYGSGINGWRLPTWTTTGAPGPQCFSNGTDCGSNVDPASSEMAHMFYVTLGNKAALDTSGNPQSNSGLTNTGLFSNIQSDAYWSATEYEVDRRVAWNFRFDSGVQFFGSNKVSSNFNAWAVHAGNVGAAVVPVPAAVRLMGSGLVGLLGWSRRKAGTLALG